MRILWIEDFGEADAESLARELFPFLEDELIQRLGNEVKNLIRGKINWPDFYQNIYAKGIQPKHEIDVCVTRVELDRLLGESPPHDRYDVVLVDIDLTQNNFFTSPLPEGLSKPERGGFWVFNQLRNNGINHKRIAFLSANLDTLPEFRNECLERYHLEPIAFGKSNSESVKLEKWLRETESEYVLFRRATLDGLDRAEAILRRDGGKAIAFNRFVGDGQQTTFDKALGDIKLLRDTLPFYIAAPAAYHQFTLLFLRTLSHPWEAASTYSANANDMERPMFWVLKNARNWSAHGNLAKDAGLRELAIIYCIHLRAMFVFSHEVLPHETKLLSLFRSDTTDQFPRSAELLESESAACRRRMKKSYDFVKVELKQQIRLNAKKLNSGNETNLEFRGPFRANANELAISTSPPDLPYHLFLIQMFWHEIARKECVIHPTVLPTWVQKLYFETFDKYFPE